MSTPRQRPKLGDTWPALVIWCVILTSAATFSRANDGDAVVVVYNSRSAESRRVANHYAKQRVVPSGQTLGLDLPLSEEISRGEFRAQLQEPLFAWLVERGLFSLGQGADASASTNRVSWVRSAKIRYAVLCHGVPLKIRPDPTWVEPGEAELRRELRRNEAAVDSELVWLPRLREGIRLAGVLTNRFYGVMNAASLHPTNGVLLVARLDGPNADIACGLVDKALAAERDGLWGRAYIDTRGIKEGAFKAGDEIMQGAAMMCAKLGYDVVVDPAPQTFGPEFPLSQVAVYAGWYSGVVSGPLRPEDVEFMPGAFAYHLHSFSAKTLRATNSHWVGPLVARGAAATLGSVYEPYLSGTSDVATLLRNWLLYGFSFGEAAWSAEFGFSWQTTVVGDPLYRPWQTSLETRLRELEQRGDRRVEWAHAMLVDRRLGDGRSPAVLAVELRALPWTQSSAVLNEKLGDLLQLQEQPAEASVAYACALQASPTPKQRLRLLLAQGRLEAALGADAAAIACFKEVLEICPEYRQQLVFQRQLLALAIKTGDAALAARSQVAIRRLTGVEETKPPPQSSESRTNH